MQSIDFYGEAEKPLLLFAYRLPFYEVFNGSYVRFILLPILLLPIASIYLIFSYFFKKPQVKSCYITVIAALSVYIICCVACLLSFANSAKWFLTLPPFIYLFFAMAALGHIFLIVHGIHSLRNQNPQYIEYKRIKEIEAQKNRKKISVKTKLTATVLTAISLMLIIFTVIVLNRYKTLITEALSDRGRAQAEQTSSVYDSAEGKYEKIAYFFENQKVSNQYAQTPFERIDIIITNSQDPVYLETLEDLTTLPSYEVFAYTTGNPPKIDADEKIITPQQAADYIKRFKNGTYKKSPVYDTKKGTCRYIYPITFARRAGTKLVGFSIVTYNQDVLLETYFKTKIFVLSMVIVFLYLAIIISAVLSDYIVNPLLYLRANVHKTSASISEVLSGSANISADTITFDENIKTSDEVHELSTEIDNMVSLIRGIVPYISFSTLKNADSNSQKIQSTTRDLCFLFTDIRGFTTLCEGLPPKKIVEILNHYLEIETKIILDNDGDIDKFVGDEMMAFFAGPKKEYNACKAAMEIRAAMRREQEISKETGKAFISIGIGIHSGKVTFGSVGASTRMDFTSIGDTVNLAARLEGANKAYGSKSIITETVYNKLHGAFVCRELDFITVKGKTEPVRIYEVLQNKNESADKIYEIKSMFEKGLEYYRAQDWAQAKTAFNECATKYHDYPSIVFLDRIRHFKRNPPPENWDGVFVMTVK